MRCQIGRGGAQHAPVFGSQRQRHQAGILRLAVAKGGIHRFAVNIGHAVRQLQTDVDGRVQRLEGIEPGQQHIAPQVRRRSQLQCAA